VRILNIRDNTEPIGFFDSGVGGLSVLARFRKLLKNENIIYYGDTLHLPYGNKTKDELIGYARNIMDFLSKKNVKAVVIACNTSSAQAYDTIKNEYDIPIYPIIQSCAQSVSNMQLKRIGVFATEATVNSGKYAQELKKYDRNIQVKELAGKDWVGIVEGVVENIEESKRNIKNEIEEMLAFKPEKIILGCTHYPYLMNEFIKYAPKDLFIDPSEMFSEYIKNDLKDKDLLSTQIKNTGYEEFYVSANPEDFVKNAKIFYDIKNLPTIK